MPKMSSESIWAPISPRSDPSRSMSRARPGTLPESRHSRGRPVIRARLDLERQLLLDRRPVEPEHSLQVQFRLVGQVLDRSGTVELDVRSFEPDLGQSESIESRCVVRLHAERHVAVDLEPRRSVGELRRVVKVEPSTQVPEIAIGPNADERIELPAPGLILGRQQPAQPRQDPSSRPPRSRWRARIASPLTLIFWSPAIHVPCSAFALRGSDGGDGLNGQLVAGRVIAPAAVPAHGRLVLLRDDCSAGFGASASEIRSAVQPAFSPTRAQLGLRTRSCRPAEARIGLSPLRS